MESIEVLKKSIDQVIDEFNAGKPFEIDDKVALELITAKLEVFVSCIYNVNY